jgi:hypothetical protein
MPTIFGKLFMLLEFLKESPIARKLQDKKDVTVFLEDAVQFVNIRMITTKENTDLIFQLIVQFKIFNLFFAQNFQRINIACFFTGHLNINPKSPS